VPTLREITQEWNRNAPSRCRQLDQGTDISHDKVLLPRMLRLGGVLKGKKVIDVGCGCGFLTNAAANYATSVIGIDSARRMIQEAQHRHSRSNLSFQASSLAMFARIQKGRYDVCFSNMSIITMPNLAASIQAMAVLLRSKGLLIFSIAHPCFWNFYRKDEPLARFNYWRPHAVKAPFRITLGRKPLPVETTYFHRPIAAYISALTRAGLHLETVVEPNPPHAAPVEYRRAFHLPRFMLFRARKA